MQRRQFILKSFSGIAGTMFVPGRLHAAISKENGPGYLPKFHLRRLTSPPNHHFFGYYGMSPWNRSETHMVCLESSFHHRLPEPGEKASIGLVDPDNGAFSPLSETSAWNLQQGAMIHWNPVNADTEIIYNDLAGNELLSVNLNILNGQKKEFARPLSAVAIKGKYALSLTYGRLSRLRKVVGYAGTVDPYANEAHPEKDGVFLLDLETGESKLLVSIAEVFEKSVDAYPLLAQRHMWFNHTVINPSGTRFLFLARSRNEKGRLDSSMFTAKMDGSDLKLVIPFGSGVSHFGWRNDKEIIATFQLPGDNELKHILFSDGEEDFRIVGENFIIGNGHCTFSPNGRWMATDRTNDQSRSQSLWLYDMKIDKGMILGTIPVNEQIFLHGDTRCDFHPRWNPSGNKICFDAIDTATQTRQMHLVELINNE
jgi:hypothetical protein